VVDVAEVERSRRLLREGNDVNQMMKVVGEEGTSMEDFILYLKSEYLDNVYLQQNAFDEVDAACGAERQAYVFSKMNKIMNTKMGFQSKDGARSFFHKLSQASKDWNLMKQDSDEFKKQEEQIDKMIAEVAEYA